jgi:hypothetical protein
MIAMRTAGKETVRKTLSDLDLGALTYFEDSTTIQPGHAERVITVRLLVGEVFPSLLGARE